MVEVPESQELFSGRAHGCARAAALQGCSRTTSDQDGYGEIAAIRGFSASAYKAFGDGFRSGMLIARL
jgi:hypothetical protein